MKELHSSFSKQDLAIFQAGAENIANMMATYILVARRNIIYWLYTVFDAGL